MTDITAFPTINPVVYALGHTITCTGAGSVDIEPGMVVDVDATGVSMTVQAALAVTSDTPIGVALTHCDVSASEKVTVMVTGIAYVTNADDTTAVDTGDWVITNDNAVGGTVSAASVAATATTLAGIQINVIGKALSDIDGDAEGLILINPVPITRANSS